jgi:hypothetical protein
MVTRVITAVLAIALAGEGSLSQVPMPVTRATERAVSFLQQRKASSVEAGLPDVRFDAWARDVVGAGPSLKWHVDTCTGVSRVLAETPMCVEVRATWPEDAGFVRLWVQVGTFARLGTTGFGWGWAWRASPDGREFAYLDGVHELRDFARLVRRDDDSSPSRLGEALARVGRVRDLPASSLDLELPPSRLGDWLRDSVPPGVLLTWSEGDCDLAGSPDLCVKVEGRHPAGAQAKVHVLIGTRDRPLSVAPRLTDNGLGWCGRENAIVGGLQEFPDLFRRAGWDRCDARTGATRE